MKVYKCKKCETLFENSIQNDSHEKTRDTEIIPAPKCPNCQSKDIEDDTLKCDVCGEECDYLIDTYGLINGSIGYICQQCADDFDIVGD